MSYIFIEPERLLFLTNEFYEIGRSAAYSGIGNPHHILRGCEQCLGHREYDCLCFYRELIKQILCPHETRYDYLHDLLEDHIVGGYDAYKAFGILEKNSSEHVLNNNFAGSF